MMRSLLDVFRHVLSVVNLDLIASALPAATLLAGIFLSLMLERFARPSCPGLARPLSSVLLHGGLFLLSWAAMFLLVQRPVFALLLVLAGQFLVIQVSNAKYRALREPFLFSDLGIFSQALKHPRLYLPFLGIERAVLIILAVVVAVGGGWWVEKPLSDFLLWAGGALLSGVIFLSIGWLKASTPLLKPEKDLARHGLFVSLAQYWLREKLNKPALPTRLPAIRIRASPPPDIVVIQSESFFDARRLFLGVRQEVLQNYDEACRAAALYGRLEVPAWGANTMRPEFAFLTSQPPACLDVHQFNPYRRAACRPLRALPSVLREAGYQTTCIHPHPARFFRRDRAFPNLGFDRFIDIRDFRNAHKFGPYISDEAVTERLLHELKSDGTPSFHFVITMENHGPLHLEEVSAAETSAYYTAPPPAGCDDLTVYLRHLQNADQQLGRLRDFLHSRTRPTILCFYGEHLPSMPKVYDVLGLPDGKTDYFLELPKAHDPERRDLEIEELPVLILRAMATI